MPGFIADFNRLCSRYVGVIVLLLSGLLGSASTTAVIYYTDLADTVSANSERSSSTQRQLERHMSAEAEYQREVRDLMRSQSSMMAMMQSDIAVLRSRAED